MLYYNCKKEVVKMKKIIVFITLEQRIKENKKIEKKFEKKVDKPKKV